MQGRVWDQQYNYSLVAVLCQDIVVSSSIPFQLGILFLYYVYLFLTFWTPSFFLRFFQLLPCLLLLLLSLLPLSGSLLTIIVILSRRAKSEMIKAAHGAYPTPEYVVMALTTYIVSLILVECTGCHLIPLKMKI